MNLLKQKQSAFSLISLLVVFVILGILTTIVMLQINSSRVSARDSKKISDIQAMRQALEMYVMDSYEYPETMAPGNPLVLGATTYLDKVPASPQPADCEVEEYDYTKTEEDYTIDYCLAKGVNDIAAGSWQANSLELAATPTGGVEGPYLAGWAKRVEITVDNSKIDSDLSHFPLLLNLSTASGTNGADLSPVFDELGSDANRFKIAVTKSDADTQLYVEIENWDTGSESAQLWVSKSDWTLASGSATTLYLYYDNSQSYNLDFIADAGSRTEVWDSNYKAVYHMNENPGLSGTYYDATGNNNNGVSYDSNTGGQGVIDGANDFDGSDDYIEINNDIVASPTRITVSAWLKQDGSVFSYDAAVVTEIYASDEVEFSLHGYPDSADANAFAAGFYNGSWRRATIADYPHFGEWTLITGLYDGSYIRLYLNDSQVASLNYTGGMPSGTNGWRIGRRWDQANYIDGMIDEVRVSDVDRSADWIKADYYSQLDSLVSYGSEEAL